MEDRIYLPTLHWFAMKNLFTGSFGAFRFRVEPMVVMRNAKEVDFESSSLRAEFWHGPYCYELSDMEAMQTFPMSEGGKEQLRVWLEENI